MTYRCVFVFIASALIFISRSFLRHVIVMMILEVGELKNKRNTQIFKFLPPPKCKKLKSRNAILKIMFIRDCVMMAVI